MERSHEAGARFAVLGPLEVTVGEEPVRLGSAKQRAVLGALLARRGSVVSTDRLIDDVWGVDAAPERQQALWVHISNLRKALRPPDVESDDLAPDIIRTVAPGYALNVDTVEVDAEEFEQLLSEGRALVDADPGAASIVLAEALELWRGPAYADFVYEPWAQAEISRLEELRLEAVETRFDADLRRGDARRLVGELEGLVRQHPTREQLTGSLMLALHRSGRSADALRAYEVLRGRLGEELGIEPSMQLRRLNDQIVVDDPALEAATGGFRPSAASADGLSVRGYQIQGRIGSSGAGALYRAIQSSIGREVVIDVIRPEFADDPDFIRRFDERSHGIARLEHPHIVPLYDSWREPGAAYVVMRHVGGRTLADVVANGPLENAQLATVVDEIGAALATAHRAGIAHGAVNARTILVDDSDHSYLSNFEVSSGAGADPVTSASSTFAITAPTITDDLVAFALVIAEAAAGRTGEMAEILVGLDPGLSAVLGSLIDDVGSSRARNVDEFRHEVLAVLAEGAAGASPVVEENPYKGLRSFEAGDARDFFGRSRFVERLVARLARSGPAGRFIAVVGPSGSGKSSVVKAGLLPALAQGAAPHSSEWFAVEMVPGRSPFEQLEAALLGVAVKPPASLLEQLSGERAIQRAVDRVLPGEEATLVVVVDQFEELFTQSSPDEAAAFLDAMVDAVMDDRGRIRFVVTLRADFYDRPLSHREVGELLRTSTELLTPMTPEDVERAVAGPAERVGAVVEPALVSELVAAVVDRPAALPLLQYTLTELFERRSGSSLTMAAYSELGGVSGALVERAEAIYVSLGVDEQKAAREIFLRLVTLDDEAGSTRRRVLLSELNSLDVGGQVQRTVDVFGRHRLLAFDRDPRTRGATVEIAHEALITVWTRFAEWIEVAQTDVRAERRLAEAAAEWAQYDEDPAFLMEGSRLALYTGWLDGAPVGLTVRQREFLRVSQEAEERRRDSRVLEEQRRVRNLRRVVVVVGTALILALVAGGVALAQQRRADRSAEEAEAQRALAADQAGLADARAAEAAGQTREAELAALISRSAEAAQNDPDLALLLALEAHRRTPRPDTEAAVFNALGASDVPNRVASAPVEFSSDETCPSSTTDLLGYGVVDGRLATRDVLTGAVDLHGPAPAPCVSWDGDLELNRTAALSTPDQSRMWFGSFDSPDEVSIEVDGTIVWFDTLRPSHRIPLVVFTDPGFEIVTYDDRTGERLGEPITVDADQIVSFESTGDSSLMALSFVKQDGPGFLSSLLVVDGDTGEAVTLMTTDVPFFAMAIDAAARELVGPAARPGGDLLTIDLDAAEIVSSVALSIGDAFGVGIRADGLVVAMSFDEFELLDRRTGSVAPPRPLGPATDMFLRSDGLIQATIGSGRIGIIDTGGNGLVEQSYDDLFAAVAVRDGFAAVTALDTRQTELIDLATGERTAVDLRLPNGDRFATTTFLPYDGGIWGLSADGYGRWSDGELVERLDLPCAGCPDSTPLGDRHARITFGPDGSRVASLVELVPGRLGVLLSVPAVDAAVAYPTLDGGMYVVDRDGTMRTYDGEGAVIDVLDTGVEGAQAIVLDAGSNQLAVGGAGVVVIDLSSGETTPLRQPANVNSLGFGKSGTVLATVAVDGDVRLWDVERGAFAGLAWDGTPTQPSPPALNDPNADSIWIPSSAQLLQIPLDPQRWVDRACEIVGRDITQEEWDLFVPGDEQLQTACE